MRTQNLWLLCLSFGHIITGYSVQSDITWNEIEINGKFVVNALTFVEMSYLSHHLQIIYPE